MPNKDGRLLPGSFGEVHFAVGSGVNKVTVPVNAMLFRAEGPRLAVVGPDGKVQLRPINIGRDYGTTLEILGGVSPTDQVVINPADSLEEGPTGDRGAEAARSITAGEPAERQRIVKRVRNFGRSRAAWFCRRMHRRSALQPARGSSAGAGCVEDATAMAASRAEGFDS